MIMRCVSEKFFKNKKGVIELCEYCKNIEPVNYRVDDVEHKLVSYEGKYGIYIPIDYCHDIYVEDINFCPMCGRNLKEVE